MNNNALVRGASQHIATIEEAKHHLKNNEILCVHVGAGSDGANTAKKTTLEQYDLDIEIIADYANAEDLELLEIYMPQGLLDIGQGAFARCKNLSKIEMPGIVTILPEAFVECESLQNIILPQSVRVIAPAAFALCINADITLPETVIEVDTDAFLNIKTLRYSGNLEGAPWGATEWIRE